mmetsp:Transcript_24170/g.50119  ORF Transcript_24170/g.50119 Transcript_24170/m.50119 type:complete len:892 (-) Transcript_24170:247-2922(-)
MRPDPSTSNNGRGEFGSPHISRMEGDPSKLHSLGNEKFSLEQGETKRSASWSESTDFATPGKDASSETTGGESNDAQRLSWSNVVKSAGVGSSSSNGLIKTSPSSETVHASNVTTSATSTTIAPTTREYVGHRSQSFDDTRHAKSAPGFYQSYSFDTSEASNFSQRRYESNFGRGGLSYRHQGAPSFMDVIGPPALPTIRQGMQVPSSPMHSPMSYPIPHYQGFVGTRDQIKPPNQRTLTYSPISLGDSAKTDQTSPMSSPASCSPRMTPLQLPRQRNNQSSLSPSPTPWQLSPARGLLNDVNEFHPESPIPPPQLDGNNFHQPHPPPQSVHHQNHQDHGSHGFARHLYSMNPPYQHGNIEHPHRLYHPGPMSPSRPHATPGSPRHQSHSMQNRRPVGKQSSSGPNSQSSMSRSPSEVLKTLLRKKACLYEPDTSHAISLVTWLVGRRLALSQGYFTRQQLQLGVHSCVASKIDEGHVTRTKVNRCMQIILNSCFHYIIPRPDGSEENGEHFREIFSKDVPQEEHLLRTLPPPWHDLQVVDIEGHHPNSSIFYGSDDDGDNNQSPGKSSNRDSSGASVESGGKRAVLLCFNENVRSAADVFRCHNEFIRDVAHSANLNLTPEEWRSFFTGTKTYKRRSPTNEGNPEIQDHMDRQGLSQFRTSWCAKRYEHDHTLCSFGHVDVNRGWLRRDPFTHNYKPTMCPNIIPNPDMQDGYFNMCPHGVDCNYAHSKEEVIYHPEQYKRHKCRSHFASCPLRDTCPNMHVNKPHGSSPEPYSHGYHRHKHSPIHRGMNPSAKKGRSASNPGHASGFTKYPGGSPMLYINPAPESEFEKTLLLPGLQALFRDYSASTFSVSTKNNAHCEFGVFGCRFVPPAVDDEPKIAPIGSPIRYRK